MFSSKSIEFSSENRETIYFYMRVILIFGEDELSKWPIAFILASKTASLRLLVGYQRG